MRFMIIVKATADSEAGVMPEESLMSAMANYHEELMRAGVLVDGSGLKPTSQGWRVRYQAGRRSVVDGPFAETKELVAGYTIIKVGSKEEALDWSKRFPNPAGEGRDAEIEVRQFFELEDFAQGEAVGRFREMKMGASTASPARFNKPTSVVPAKAGTQCLSTNDAGPPPSRGRRNPADPADTGGRRGGRGAIAGALTGRPPPRGDRRARGGRRRGVSPLVYNAGQTGVHHADLRIRMHPVQARI
jgi:hypothetical protein